MEQDYYRVLDVSRQADPEEIKRSFQRLVKRLHPDKHDEQLSSAEREAAIEQFHLVTTAYAVLSDQNLRKEYDTKITALELTQQWPISDTIILEDMDYDTQSNSYSHWCRCGGSYQIGREDLSSEIIVVCCSGCTLCIKVICSGEARQQYPY